jgi:cytochrome c-type biogenesis protein
VDSSIFFGGSVVAAVVAGAIALFAPCCISVMLPSYFASAFQNRRLLVAMTFLFGAGVATVILPIALGAAALQRLFVSEHALIYVGAGVFLLPWPPTCCKGARSTCPCRAAGPAARRGR